MTEPAGLIRRLLRDERVRFLLIGGVNTVVGYGFFVLFQFLLGERITYFASLLLAHLCASLLAFVLYRLFVFRVRGRVLIDFMRFQVVYLVPLGANLLALPALVEVGHLNVYLAQALIVLASTVVSFIGHKFFSFRRTTSGLDVVGDPLTAEPGDRRSDSS